MNQIEGAFSKGQSVVVVEDLISTGKSSLMAVDALRNAELKINGMNLVFSVMTFQYRIRTLKQVMLNLKHLVHMTFCLNKHWIQIT